MSTHNDAEVAAWLWQSNRVFVGSSWPARARRRADRARYTGPSVRAIVVAWSGEPDVDTILQAYSRLTAADIADALADYDAHRQELDERIGVQLTGV